MPYFGSISPMNKRILSDAIGPSSMISMSSSGEGGKLFCITQWVRNRESKEIAKKNTPMPKKDMTRNHEEFLLYIY